FPPDLIDDLRRNDHRGNVDPIHVRLPGESARDVDLRQSAVVNQNIEHARLAVQMRTCAIDLFAGKESSVLENAEHIVFVVLHLGRNSPPSLAQTGSISSSVGKKRGAYGNNACFLRTNDLHGVQKTKHPLSDYQKLPGKLASRKHRLRSKRCIQTRRSLLRRFAIAFQTNIRTTDNSAGSKQS